MNNTITIGSVVLIAGLLGLTIGKILVIGGLVCIVIGVINGKEISSEEST